MSPSVDSAPRDSNASAPREPGPDRAGPTPGERGAGTSGPGASRFATLLGAAGGDDATGAAAGGVERRRGRQDDDGSSGRDADRGGDREGGNSAAERPFDATPPSKGQSAVRERGPGSGAPGVDPHALGVLQALSEGIVKSLRVGTVTTGTMGALNGALRSGRGMRTERVVHMELGKGPWRNMQVRLQTRGREVDVRLCVRDDDAAERARSVVDRLRAALERRGVRVGNLDVQLDSGGTGAGEDGAARREGEPCGPRTEAAQTSRARGPAAPPENDSIPPLVGPAVRGEYMV